MTGSGGDGGTAFGGFPVEALDFYDDLEDDNSRTFWTAHKQVYLDAVRTPMTRLLGLLEPEFGPGKAFRPHRDLRFSHDPTPYKTHQGGFVARGHSSGWYVQVDAAGLRVAGGFYDTSAALVARYRAAVDDPRTGAELDGLVTALTADGFAIGGERLKTRPRGYDPDHPRIELLRHKQLFAGREYYDAPAWLHTAEAGPRVRADWAALAPLVEWVAMHVSPPAE